MQLLNKPWRRITADYPAYFTYNLMKDFSISVRKLTDADLMREACEMTFLGKSRQTLLSMYKSEHSPSRTQIFWIKFHNIPLYVSTHLIRHSVGSTPFQLSLRTDKGNRADFKEKVRLIIDDVTEMNSRFKSCTFYNGEDEEAFINTKEELEWLIENTDRETPVNLGLLINAQSLIDIAKLRLCCMSSPETQRIFSKVKQAVSEVDPSLANVMVRKCVYRNGLCGEPKCCGFNSTPLFTKELADYLQYFTTKQQGIKDENEGIEA